MTSLLFAKWMQEWDKELRLTNKRILLLVDNCGAHPKLHLDQIQIEFLPANTTSLLQSLEAGLIQQTKACHRKRLLRSILHGMDDDDDVSASSLVKQVSLLDAVNLLASAWDDIKQDSIMNC